MIILVSGGNGLLARELLEQNPGHDVFALSRDEMDVSYWDNVTSAVTNIEPDVFIHCAALTSPMSLHEEHPVDSIFSNIIGSAHVAAACQDCDIKPVYISTDYVYPGDVSDSLRWREDDGVLPINKYAWSKLGGEAAFHIIPGSLILRCAFTERPFKHAKAFTDSFKTYTYVDEIAPIIWRLIDKNATGVVNVGGKAQSVYDFARESFPDVGKASRLDVPGTPSNTAMDLTRLRGLLDDPTL